MMKVLIFFKDTVRFLLRMKCRFFMMSCILFCSCNDKIAVFISDAATTVEEKAAYELAADLSKMYDNCRFVVKRDASLKKEGIYMGTFQSMPLLAETIGKDTALVAYDGYIVRNMPSRVLIYGKSDKGIMNGSYGLLNALDYGSYIHRDAVPAKSDGKLALAKINDVMSNPVVQQRINFAWHNFLSGCSSWDLSDWEHWIKQSQKVGFNAIMLHCYGNSPMFQFEYNGVSKWVSRMANSKEGREWRIQHCQDIRNAIGGTLFKHDYFGSEMTVKNDVSHQTAVREFTDSIIRYASQRGMETIMAIDVDTKPALCQNVICTLPEEARIKIEIPEIDFLNQSAENLWLPNPDTEAGYGYYKAQVQSLIHDYPTLNNICLWFRIQATPLMGLKKSDLPQKWQKEYEALLKEKPEAEKYWRSVGIFALGKVTEAYKRAAAEIAPSLTVSIGTWFKSFLPAADYFIAKDVPFIFLDYPYASMTMVGNEKNLCQMKQITSHRKVTPIYWGQEDNGYYYGATLKPVEKLGTKSQQAGLHGFGIIQWMHKPTELFVSHMNRQLWTDKLDESLEASVNDYVKKHFSQVVRPEMNKYFIKWLNEGVAVGRESGIRFITERMANRKDVIQAGIKERVAILERALEKTDSQNEKELMLYYYHLENFISKVIDIENHFFRAEDLLVAGKIDEARKEVLLCNIEEVINYYAEYISFYGLTKEELGLLVSMNLRWYPSYVQLRSAVGLDELRFNFAHTDYEPLVHEPGWATYFFDQNKKLWETFGTHEISGTEWKRAEKVDVQKPISQSYVEVMQTGLKLEDSVMIQVRPNPHEPQFTMPLPSDYLSPGKYKLTILATADEDCEMIVKLTTNDIKVKMRELSKNSQVVVQEPRAERFVYTPQQPQQMSSVEEHIMRGTPIKCLTYPVELKTMGNINVEIIPTEGAPVVCGLTLKKVD